jgi:plastocyanin
MTIVPTAFAAAACLTIAILSARAAGDPTVTIENFIFKPAALTIHAGNSVIFKNADDIPHSVVMSDGSFHSKALDTDDHVSVAFPKPGDYGYFCGLHPHMQGVINVVP